MEEIDRIRSYDEENFETSRKALGDTYEVFAAMVSLYDLLRQLVRDSKVPQRDDIVAGVMFLLGCRYALVRGVLEVMRGHLMDSLWYARSAIEQTGFADLVRRNPALAMIWLKAGDNPAAYEKYKKSFKTAKAFPKGDALLQRLYGRYDFASQRVHNSLHSFATRLKTERDPESKSTEIQYSYFDVKNPTDLVRIFLWTLDTHFGIVQVFTRVLEEAVRFDQTGWDLRYNALDATLGLHKERWRPVIAPEQRV